MDSNYLKVFKTIAYSTNPVNAAEMSDEQSISFPTISRIINNMRAKGLVELVGHEKIASGRSRNLYSLSPEYTNVISIFINKDNVKVFLADFCGKILAFEMLDIHYQSSEQLIQQMFGMVRKILGAKYPETDYWQMVSCIGICVAGLTRYEGEEVYTTINELDGWENIEIKRRFVDEFGLQVFVEKDTVAGLLGAKRRFSPQDNIVFIRIDVGIGCAMLINGSIYRGGNNYAGEIEEMLEGYCDIRRIKREVYELYCENKDFKLMSMVREAFLEIRGPEDFDLQLLDRLAIEGDYQIIELLYEAIRAWTKMIVNICCCIDPELIVIDGQVTGKTPYILERLKVGVERQIKREINIQSIDEGNFLDVSVNYFTVSALYDFMANSLD